MVAPPAGDIGFLQSRGARADAAIAARTMQPPSATAKAVMANGGKDPSAVTPVVTPPPALLPQG
jgi:hypothetical protein